MSGSKPLIAIDNLSVDFALHKHTIRVVDGELDIESVVSDNSLYLSCGINKGLDVARACCFPR